MSKMIEILKAARCGTLAHICCMTKDQFIYTVHFVQDMDAADADILYQAVCSCSAPTSATPQSDKENACASKILSFLCDEKVMFAITAAQKACTAALLITKGLPGPLKARFIALTLVLSAMESACLEKTASGSLITAVCKVVDWVEDLTSFVPDELKPMMGPIASLLTLGISDAVKDCCDGSEPPGWAQEVGGVDVTDRLTAVA